MTVPTERTRAVLDAREFLFRLIDPAGISRIPSVVREEARNLLRHYPTPLDMETTARATRGIWEMPK